MKDVRIALVAFAVAGALDLASPWPAASVRQAHAQEFDDFSDGDFTRNPTWAGDVHAWAVESIDGDNALVSNGASVNDTIYLAAPLPASSGRWTFTFSHRRVNLSTFNGARIFICASNPSVRSNPSGYYIQMGTNNGDAVSLWRVDGDWSSRRELARSAGALVEGDSSRLRVEVVRDAAGSWQVTAGGASFSAGTDNTYAACSHLAVWVKHSSAGRSSFIFDAFAAYPEQPNLPAGPLPRPGDVVISEVQVHPPPSASEFVELFNRSTSSFALKRLTIRDSVSPPIPITDGSEEILPGGYFVLVQNGPAFQDQYRTVPFVVTAPWPALNNGGDRVVLESNGEIIDSMSYVGADVVPGHSLERIDPAAPSDRFNFVPSIDAFGATPGAQNSRFAPDTSGPVMIIAREIGDGMLEVIFDEPVRVDSIDASWLTVGGVSATVIQAGAPDRLQATFEAPIRGRTVRLSTIIDRSGNRSIGVEAPIAFLPRQHDVIINEVLYEPLADSRDGLKDQVEFVELLNRSSRRLHLDGLFRTRDPDEHGDADTARVGASFISMDPGDFVVLAGDTIAIGSPVLVARPFTLRNEGDRLRLHGPDVIVLDDLFFHPAWHHPDVLDRRGVSLERIDAHAPGDDPSNWTSSVARSGSTPGLPNSVRLRSSGSPTEPGLTIEPNPFSPDRDGVDDVVKITYIPSAGPVRLRVRIFELSGVMVREVVSAHLVAEPASFLWDGLDEAGRQLRTGIYVVLLEAHDSRNGSTRTLKRPLVLARRY